ncbi:uncharacterized protein PgNI_09746 [Pyricularia grisea]|uniref:Uncharacterized protein n=1 Tax=Pyricularia grisea TaxID=148305 RepID=A0A6P8ASU2_PYRGI|nr:uncharacterized protein PgNI_09746 [Pyricularia grisea]TLD05194.1 hypothetical protein PgNI_09746 [Pyricularia grisea]
MAPIRLNIPPVTRILLIGLVVQSLLGAAIRYRQWSAESDIVIPYLNLVPQLSLVYPWTFVTTTLVESNLITLALAGVTIYHGGRYLERAWSSREFAKFLLVCSLIPNFLCFAIMFIFFVLTRNERWTLTTIGGSVPLQISFLVAFSQLVPAHTVTLFRGILSLRVPRFPLLYIGVITALSLTPLLSSTPFFLGIFGLLTSWTYLRFYKTAFPDLDSSQPSSLRGDASETFAFAEFFPAPAKPLVAALSEQVFNVLVAMRICVPFSQADMMSAASRGNGGGDGAYLQRAAPGTARAEAERRRAIALKALDQRLHAATANAASRAAPGDSAAGPSAPVPPPAQTSGPTVSNQPRAMAPAEMTSHAENKGDVENTYAPEREISGKSEF